VLTDALRSEELNLKVAAIEALSGLEKAAAPAAPALIRLLEDPHEVVWRPALRSLARIGRLPPEIRPQLMKFAEDRDEYIRAGAAIALLRVDPKDEFAKKVAVSCLALEMPRTVRTSTLYLILAMRGDAVVFEDELNALTSDKEEMVAMWARQALKNIAGERRSKK
jgi:hypothetical protein